MIPECPRPHHERDGGPFSPPRTDYIGLYFIHHVDIQTPPEDVLTAFDAVARQGKLRYATCSYYKA